MKNILHIFPDEKFTIPYIKFINKNFGESNQKFFIYGLKDNTNKYDDFHNVILENKFNYVELNRLIKESYKVIIHSFFVNKKIKFIMLKNITLLKNFCWVIWGKDLYEFSNKKNKIKICFNKFLISKFGSIASLVKGDYNLAKEICKAKGVYRKAIYINPISSHFLDNVDNVKSEDCKINIQIGNSADKSNKHLEAIDLLSKFKNENIRVYVPLSYGDKSYAQNVINHGREIFGEKFIGITDYMDSQAYSEFLGKIDIAVFNNNRQQALGNIFALAYLGKKIYLRKDTTMWTELVDNEKYEFYDASRIASDSFSQIIDITSTVISNNKLKSKERFSEEFIKNIWESIFR